MTKRRVWKFVEICGNLWKYLWKFVEICGNLWKFVEVICGSNYDES